MVLSPCRWRSPSPHGLRYFVLNLGGSYNAGEPTRSLYHFKLLIHLVETVGFHLAQECFWYNPAKLPTPAEWVNVRRVRIKDSVEYVWWLSKTPHPKANNAKEGLNNPHLGRNAIGCGSKIRFEDLSER